MVIVLGLSALTLQNGNGLKREKSYQCSSRCKLKYNYYIDTSTTWRKHRLPINPTALAPVCKFMKVLVGCE